MPVQYGSFLESAVHSAAKWVPVNMDRDDIVCGVLAVDTV